jgi:hypothetical protein
MVISNDNSRCWFSGVSSGNSIHSENTGTPSAGVNDIVMVDSDTFHRMTGRNHSCIVTRQVDFNCCSVFRTITQRDRLTPSLLGGISQHRLNNSMTIPTDFPLPMGPRTSRMGLLSPWNFASVGGALYVLLMLLIVAGLGCGGIYRN